MLGRYYLLVDIWKNSYVSKVEIDYFMTILMFVKCINDFTVEHARRRVLISFVLIIKSDVHTKVLQVPYL